MPPSPSTGRPFWVASRAVLAIAAALLCSVPAARAAESPPLTATTVVTATGTGYARVRVAEPMKFVFATDTPKITVSDPSTFVALLLVQVPADGPPTGPMLKIVAMPSGQQTEYVYSCGGRTDPSADPGSFCHTGEMPAGDYRLYVVATGPQQVRVELPAPAGIESLTASIPAISHSVVAAAPGLGGTLVAPALTANDEFALPHKWGMLITSYWMRGTNVAIGSEANCMYPASTPTTLAGPATAFACPNGGSVWEREASYHASWNLVGGGYGTTSEPGTFGIKMTASFAGVIQDSVVSMIWLDWGA